MRAWVLLIGFALAGVGLGVTLPEVAGGEELPPPKVTLHLTAAGTRHLGGNPTALPPTEDPAEDRALFTGLAGVGSGPGARVRLYADAAAPASALVPILVTMVDLGTSTVDLAVGDGRRGFPLELGGYDEANLVAVNEWARSLTRIPPNLALGRDAVAFGRDGGVVLSASGEGRFGIVRRVLAEERRLHPGERSIVLRLSEDLPVADVVSVFSQTRAAGYRDPLLLVVPPADLFPPILPAPAAARAPARTKVSPTGRIEADGVVYEIGAIERFVEDCAVAPCVVAAVPKAGAPFLVGTRVADAADPLHGAIFDRPVVDAPGYAAGLAPPTLEGAFAPLARVEGRDTPTPPFGGPLLTGGAAGTKELDARRREFDACYQRARVDRPDLRGDLTVLTAVGPDGEVRAAHVVRSTLGSPELAACVEAVVRGVSFARPGGGGFALVSYPITFRP